MRYSPRRRPSWDIRVSFFSKLGDLGMLGYESLHAEFAEVVHYVSENYAPEPSSSSPKTIECPPHHMTELEADSGDL